MALPVLSLIEKMFPKIRTPLVVIALCVFIFSIHNRKLFSSEESYMLSYGICYFVIGLFSCWYCQKTGAKKEYFIVPVFVVSVSMSILAYILNQNNFPVRTPGLFVIGMTSFSLGYSVVKQLSYSRKTLTALIWVLLLMLHIFWLIPTYNVYSAIRQSTSKIPLENASFLDAEGKPIRLDDFKGKIIILDFWFLGCRPCRAKFPSYDQIARKYQNNKNVMVVAITMGKRDSIQEMKLFSKQQSFQFIYWYDLNNQVTKLFGVEGAPHEFIIDSKGVIRYSHLGFDSSYQDIYIVKTSKLVNDLISEL